jgi:hypothetical protein
MSQIFAPGAIAGPAGPAGPPVTFRGVYNAATSYAVGDAVSSGGSSYISLVASNVGNVPATSPTQWAVLASVGAAGSVAAITTLEASLRLTPVNLLNYAAAQQNYITNSDGTLGFHAPGTIGGGPPIATNLLYCPGAVGLICSSVIATAGFGPGAFIHLFDANGNFIGNATDPGSYHFDPGNVLTLPGTQTYVRLTLASGMSGSFFSIPQTMICAGSAPTLPGSFQPFGLDSIADVNAKDAAVAATAQTNLLNALTVVPSEFATVVLPGGPLGTRNAFDYKSVLLLHDVATDGSTPTSVDHNVATIYCPLATQFISNLAFEANGAHRVCTYDAFGNFIADITGTITTSDGNFYSCGTVGTLPGTQTYLKLAYAPPNVDGGAPSGHLRANSVKSAVFYAGTAASPVPTSLTMTNWSVPSPGNTDSANAVTATALGAVADGMDCTGVMQAFLNTGGSASNPIELILDGMFQTTGLVVKSYTTIRGIGWGSGLTLRSGSNQNVITAGATGSGPFGQNAARLFNITLPTRATTNVTLSNFTVNQNDSAQTDGFGVIFVNCSNVLMDRMNFTQAFYFASVFSNCDHVWVRDCRFTSAGTIHDGVHLDGPVEKVWIDGCKFATGDDAIAINCPEGYGGDISDVVVSNCIFDNSLTVARIYTSLQPAAMATNNIHTARRIVFSNCTGTTRVCAFSLGINGPSGNQSQNVVDQIEDLLIENCDIASDTSGSGLSWILVSDAVGLIQARGCVMRAPQSTAPFIMFNGTSQAGQIVLSDITILRNPDGHASVPLFDNTGAISVGKLTVRGCRVADEVGSSYTAIANAMIFGATLAELVIDSLEMDHFTALAASFTNVTIARGAGLLGTGAQIADATMDNNALYLSSNASGAPSIKVGGTAKRLTLA